MILDIELHVFGFLKVQLSHFMFLISNRYLPINRILVDHSKEINTSILDRVQVRKFLGSSLNLGFELFSSVRQRELYHLR